MTKINFVKDCCESRGRGIEISLRRELESTLEQEGDYKPGKKVIQEAVKDLLTVESGPLAQRRFDLRYYLIFRSSHVYLHSNMFAKWALDGPTYDANDRSLTNQVFKLTVYDGADTARLYFPEPGHEWSSSRRQSDTKSLPVGSLDPNAWREELYQALVQAKPVFKNVLDASISNRNSYVLLGGDAMVKSDGKIVLVEFNNFPEILKYERLRFCVSGEVPCHRMVLFDPESSFGYRITEPTPATDVVSSEYVATVVRDTVALVMGFQKAEQIGNLREVISENNDK